MDPKARMPDIKSDVNKAPGDDKKKASGLLALLFGGGGLLATKAGFIALAVMGSAVAGGLGLAGYKIFGPGESDRTGGSFTLFTSKPKGAEADPDAVAPVKADGSSASLDFMAAAAAKDRAADAAEQAAADALVSHGEAAAAKDEDASSGGSEGALNAGSAGDGAVGAMGKGLAGVKKLGALSKAAAGGGSSASASGGGKLGEGLPAASKGGASSAFSKGGPGAKASSSAGRGVASRRSGSSRRQLASVMRDQRGAGSSVAGGRTYDGAGKTAGSAIGPDGGAIGMDGAGAGSGAQSKSLAKNSAPNTNTQEPPIPKAKHMVTPWEKAVGRAQMLVLLAMGLAFLSSQLGTGAPWMAPARYAIGGIVTMIGAYITYLGSQVMSGPYGQTLQGSVVIAAGLGVTLMGVSLLMGAEADSKAPAKADSKTPEPHDPGGLHEMTSKPTTPASTTTGPFAGINSMVLLGGGLAAVSTIALMFLPKPKPVEIEEGWKKPDIGYHRVVKETRYWT